MQGALRRPASSHELSINTGQVVRASPRRSAPDPSGQEFRSAPTLGIHRLLPLMPICRRRASQPADQTTDLEFIRRVTLDLTGRIPTPDRVSELRRRHRARQARQADRRTAAKPEWVDKWTMYFGDLYQNTDRTSTFLNRFRAGPQRVLQVDPRFARREQAL